MPTLVGPDGGERAIEAADRSGHQRPPGEVAGIRNQIARGEIVGAVGDKIVLPDQRQRIAGVEPRGMGLDRHMGIEARDRGRGAGDLRVADLRRAMNDLPLQIGQRDGVVVDDAERADAGGREIEQDRSPQPARPDHQDARTLERRLAGPAHLAQHDVAGIALEFIGVQHEASYISSKSSRGRRRRGAVATYMRTYRREHPPFHEAPHLRHAGDTLGSPSIPCPGHGPDQ